MTSEPQPIIYNQPNWYVENVYQTVSNYHLPPERQPLWVDVPSLTAHFIGRDAIVADLSARLTAGGSVALSAEGKPGVGKTTLAVALAHHREVLAHFSDGVLWAGLGPQPDLPSRLARWADALGLDISDRPTVEARAQAVRDAIGHKRLLLVIDDAWGLEAAETLRCGGPNCAHLLTSRDQRLALQFAGHSERVEELTPADALELLRRLAPKAVAVDEAQAAGLLAAVGYLPLAVELLGGYLAAGASARFADASRSALADLTDPARRLSLATRRLGDGSGRQVSLQETIALSIDGLAEELPAAVTAFYSLGAFAPKPASFDLTAAQAVAECDADALALLIDRNLLEQGDDESLALHQTIADVARTRTSVEAVVRHREHYLARVKADEEDWQGIKVFYPQIQRAWQQTPSANPATIVFVDTLEPYQTRRGFWTDRLDWLAIALDAAKKKGDANGRALMLTYYGFVYDVLEEKSKALSYYEDALHWQRLIGDRNGEARTLGNIGGIFYQLGEKSTALEYYEDALHLQRLIGDRTGQARTLNNIGALYDAVGEMANALKYFVEALYLQRVVEDRSGEAVALNNIGGVYYAWGEKVKAFEYFMEALPLRRLLGDLSGEATTLNNMGGIYAGFGQVGDALECYETALSLCRQVGNRREEAKTLNSIGVAYDDFGERNKALEYYEKSLTLFRQVGDYRGEATTLNNIGQVYAALGEKAKALEYYEDALHLKGLVEDPFGESVTRFNMAMIFKDIGQLAEAEQQLEVVVQIDETVGHPDLQSDRRELERVRAMRR